MSEQQPLRLQDFMKREQLVNSGGEAKHAIQGGLVSINGVVDTRRKRQLQPGDVVRYEGREAVVE
jgi:ribosome-associated protein